MASAQSSTGNARSVFDAWAANPQQLKVGLFILNIVLACVPLVLVLTYKGWATSPKFAVVVTVLLEVAVLITSLIYSMPAPGSTLTGANRVRVLVLTIAGLIGAAAALLGLGLPFTERLKPIFSAGIEGWRAHKSAIGLCGSLLFGGLILMFVGVQLARTFERTRSDMRRILYGYNAFLSTVLLIAALGLLNVLAYAGVQPFKWFDKSIDWTSNKIYTLKDNTRSLLSNLHEPVKIYVLMPNEIIRNEATTLLDNFRSASDEVSWQSVSRDRDSATLAELQKKYLFREVDGLLVVYGTGDKQVSEFVKTSDLFDVTGPGSFNFKGEGALTKVIDYLASGKAKAKIYFTQGEGELNVQSRAGMGREGDDSMSDLFGRLGKGNYELRELHFSADVTRIPDDADVVVIARPTKTFSKQAVDALRSYVRGDDKKKGKLFILFDVAMVGDKWTRTGLEEMVQEFGVKVNEDEVFDAEQRNPASLQCITNPMNPTPIGPAFWSQGRGAYLFNMRDARTVEAASAAPEQGSRFTVSPLVFVASERVWVEKNPTAINPVQKKERIQEDPAYREKTIAKNDTSVAVTVTEPRTAAMRANPHNFGGDQQPRMVVFGDASWINDTEMAGGRGSVHFALFGACVSWLRERPDVTSDEKTQRDVYMLNVKNTDAMRLFFQPLGLMVLGVIGLGGAVWVARRR